jgi:peroxiredoxin
VAYAKRAVQALAVVLVAGLFGVLVWRFVHDERTAVPVVLDERKPVPAPEFSLPQLKGDGELALASLRGKAVVLNFWASWCAPCEDEIPTLEEAWKEHRGRGLVVLGIDILDSSRDARSFAERLRMTYPLVRDSRGKLLDRFSVAGLPQTLFVNRRGKLVGSRIQGGVDLDKNRDDFERGIALALRR